MQVILKENSIKKERENLLKSLVTGVIGGVFNGLFGGGGGMIIVFTLNKLLNFSEKESHATAIAIILPMSIVSGILYFTAGNFPISSGLPVSIGVAIGGTVGAFLLKKFSPFIVAVIFSLAMVSAGVKLCFF